MGLLNIGPHGLYAVKILFFLMGRFKIGPQGPICEEYFFLMGFFKMGTRGLLAVKTIFFLFRRAF